MTTPKWVKHSEPVTLIHFDEDEQNRVHAYLPYLWSSGDGPHDGIGGSPVDDPLTIYFGFPVGNLNVEDVPMFEITLDEIIEDCVDDFRSPATWEIQEAGIMICAKIRDRLRELADSLDSLVEGSADLYPNMGAGTK